MKAFKDWFKRLSILDGIYICLIFIGIALFINGIMHINDSKAIAQAYIRHFTLSVIGILCIGGIYILSLK